MANVRKKAPFNQTCNVRIYAMLFFAFHLPKQRLETRMCLFYRPRKHARKIHAIEFSDL